mgnify:CR=1 FL=1
MIIDNKQFIAKLIIIPATIIKIKFKISVVIYLYKNKYAKSAPNGSDRPLIRVVVIAFPTRLVE